MAVETQISAKGSRNHHTFYLKVTETGYDIATNQSTLSFDFWLVDDNNWYWSTQGTNVSYKVEIGSSYWAGYIPHHTTKTTDVRSESGLKFTHNSDGTLTLPIKFTVTDSSSISYLPGNASASGNLVCTTIPRASAISLNVSSYTVSASSGNAFQWTITPQSNTFYNKLRYTLGNKDISNPKGTGTKSGYFTNQELLNALPNTKSGTLTVYCYTYSDANYSNLVGTKSVAITVSVSLKPSAPTLTTIGFRNRSSGVNSAITTPTAGYTTVALTAWSHGTSYGAGSYTTYFSVNQGATLKTSSATANNTVIETNTLPSSAKQYTLTMTAYTVDSRGNQSTDSTITCAIYGYQPPVASLQAFRTASSSSTAEDGAGTYARVLFSNSLRGQTDANGALRSGNQNAVVSATCTRSGYSSGSCTSGTNYSLSDTGTMTFTYTVTDRFTTSKATVIVPTASYPLDLYDDGNGNVGMGIGAVAVANRITSALPIHIDNTAYISVNDWHAGSTTYTGNVNNGVHSIAGKLYFASGNSASADKSIYAMNHAGSYKAIVSVDQSNNATFYGTLSGNATSANSATNATNATNATTSQNAYRWASYWFNGDGTNTNKYIKLGTLVANADGRTAEIIVFTGQGFNANAWQNGWAKIQIKNSWQSSQSATSAFGITYQVYGFQMSAFEVVGIATDYQTLQVWIKTPWTYGQGNYLVSGVFTSWTDDGGATQSTTVPSGTQQPRAKIYSDESIILWEGSLLGGASAMTLPAIATYCRRFKIYAYMAGELNMIWEVNQAYLDASTARHVNHAEPIYISNPGGWYMTTAQVKMTKTTIQFESALNIRFDGTNHVVTQNNSSNYRIYRIDGIL